MFYSIIIVEAVAKEDQAERPANSVVPSLDVTVLTSDVSFLCDAKQECHKRGLKKFWERARPLFENTLIRSIEIVVAETGSIILSNADSQKIDDNGVEKETDETAEDEKDCLPEDDQHDDPPTHEILAAKCIHSIKAGLSTRAEADYKKTRSSEDPPSAVVVNVSTISNDRLGYHELVQKWLNDLLALARDKGAVSFELPESLDGMQCALSFEATYKVFPFRADSIAASGAMADLQLLLQSKFQVVQLMPLSCVDAHLVFGQPIEVRAKLESDLAQYNEMKALVGSVLRYLSEKEVALLLRATNADGTESTDVLANSLYHTDGQTFLLMAEELPCRNLIEPSQSQPDTKANTDLPTTGMLVRYAIAEQLLDCNSSKRFAPEGVVESMTELSDYVENVLDCLPSNDVNLLLDYAVQHKIESSSTTVSTAAESCDACVSEEALWTDNDGVGARVAQARANDQDVSMDDISTSDDSMNVDWNAFSYD